MGLLDRLRNAFTSTAPNGQPVYYRAWNDAVDTKVLDLTVEDLWRTQPYLRTVVTFLARNIAQLGIHTFQRVDDNDRQRIHTDPLAQLLAQPNARQTTYELIYRLVADLALYDEGIWWIGKDATTSSGWAIQPIPPSWVVERGGGTVFAPDWYLVQPPTGREPVRIPASDLLVFQGWSPDDLIHGSSPVNALKQILAEQIHAHTYRQQVWEKGGRVGNVITRPAGVEWSAEARERFKQDWNSKWTGKGPKAGGTPILEDGMTLSRVGFSAHEEEFVEAAKLSLALVAGCYHVNPTMVGLLDNANYSNVREFRRMLYGDTLGPTMAQIEARINAFLVPKVAEQPDLYCEFNIAEKLQGSFEEQAAAMQAATGGPWMLRSEARARMNLPYLDEADELITPLNVLVGGQASPHDTGSQNQGQDELEALLRGSPPQHTVTDLTPVAQRLAFFFARQSKAVRSRLGANSAEWWEAERWDRELAADLGLTPQAAALINEDTKQRIEHALASADPANGVARVFETQPITWAKALAALPKG